MNKVNIKENQVCCHKEKMALIFFGLTPPPLRSRGLYGDTFYNLYSFIFKSSHDSNQNVNNWPYCFKKQYQLKMVNCLRTAHDIRYTTEDREKMQYACMYAIRVTQVTYKSIYKHHLELQAGCCQGVCINTHKNKPYHLLSQEINLSQTHKVDRSFQHQIKSKHKNQEERKFTRAHQV